MKLSEILISMSINKVMLFHLCNMPIMYVICIATYGAKTLK